MFSALLNLVTRVGLSWVFFFFFFFFFFLTQKDGNLEINSLALNNYFSYRNVVQNGVNALSEMVLKNPGFCQKTQNFVYFGPYNFAQISPECGPYTCQIMYGEALHFRCQY